MPPDPINQQIGALIKAHRTTLHMKQEALAAVLHVTRGAVANLENGKQNILVSQLYRIAKALEVSPFHLLPGPEPEHDAVLTDLPLPSDLKAAQKAQVQRFFEQVTPAQERGILRVKH